MRQITKEQFLAAALSKSDHQKAHGSLERIAFGLFKDGLVHFDPVAKEYKLKKVK